MRKKLWFSLFIALMIISCSRDAGERIAGTWTVEKMFLDTSDVTMQNLQGEKRWIRFNEDGSLETDQFSGTWDYNDENQLLTIINTESEGSSFKWIVDFENDKMIWTGAEGNEANRMKVQLVKTDEQLTRTAPAQEPMDEPTTTVKDTSDLNIGKATIDSLNVNIMESMPVQVSVLVKGFLSDGCTSIHRVDRKKEGNTFIIDVFTERPKDAMCTQALVPFEQTVPLDVQGLSAGTYKVKVHDREASFTLEANN